MAAEIHEGLCSGCGICADLCPYKAIGEGGEDGLMRVHEILCRGCGVCAAACPSGAIKAHHFTDEQISAEIKGLVAGVEDRAAVPG